MSGVSKGALILGAAYLVAGVGVLGYAVYRGLSTGATFDGLTGTEPEALKPVELVLAWPIALPLMLAK